MQEYKSILNEVQVAYIKSEAHRSKIKSSKDVARTAKIIWPTCIEHREAVVALYLNRANNTVGYAVIGIGGVSSSTADIKLIFQKGLLCNASSVILIHNHPSGNLEPSQSDVKLTNKVKEAGKVMDMPLLDHLIITDENYYSFADEWQLK